jgi:hypothetical protein
MSTLFLPIYNSVAGQIANPSQFPADPDPAFHIAADADPDPVNHEQCTFILD